MKKIGILGAMDELGEATIERHTWIGAQLVLRSQDRAVCDEIILEKSGGKCSGGGNYRK